MWARRLLPWIALVVLTAGAGLAQTAKKTGKASTKGHVRADVLKLLDLEGMKTFVEVALQQTSMQGKASIAEACPFCTPEFHEEFARRFEARLRVRDLLALYAEIYEKHYTRGEILQLIAMDEGRKKDPVFAITAELQARLDAVKPGLQSDIQGKTAEYSGKLASETFVQIETEHPGWVKRK
jgi:hypothetical protein